MDRLNEEIIKALNGILPEDAVNTISGQITSTIKEYKTQVENELKEEFQEKLDEAYNEIKKTRESLNEEMKLGYTQAYDLICEYKDRLRIQHEEHERMMDEGFQEAYDMLEEEKQKNTTLEMELNEEYEQKYQSLKKWYAQKLDQFLPTQREKYIEAVKKDLLNDPTFAENKLAFDKMLEAAATVLSEEDFAVGSKAKLDTVAKENEDLKGKLKILESRNMRLSMDNNKLQESVRLTESRILKESVEEKKERIKKAKKVEGRGSIINEDRQVQVVIGEKDNEPARETKALKEAEDSIKREWAKLSGVTIND